MSKYRLWYIDFDTAMNFENGMFVLQAYSEPTEQECIKILHKYIMSGAIYFNSVREIKEIDMRFYRGEITLMNMEVVKPL